MGVQKTQRSAVAAAARASQVTDGRYFRARAAEAFALFEVIAIALINLFCNRLGLILLQNLDFAILMFEIVALATLFSLFTQAYALGGHASTFAADLGVSPLVLVLGILPHALPELFALFLPLAAWTLASRAGRWEELLAATFVTTGLAIPILLLAGAVEVWVSPRLLLALAG